MSSVMREHGCGAQARVWCARAGVVCQHGCGARAWVWCASTGVVREGGRVRVARCTGCCRWRICRPQTGEGCNIGGQGTARAWHGAQALHYVCTWIPTCSDGMVLLLALGVRECVSHSCGSTRAMADPVRIPTVVTLT